MALQPVPFEDFSGGMADNYIGTDVTRAESAINFLIDETKKPNVRFGTTIYPNRIPGSFRPSGVYVGPEPFSHTVVINGPSAYTASETTAWSEILGTNTTFLPTKQNEQESAMVWRRQVIAGAPVTSLPPAMIYATVYQQPSTPATPATYKALTLGLPALATKPTIPYLSTDAYQAVYAFYYKYTFIDYTGTLFAFFGNPNKPGLVNGSVNDALGPSSTNIAISAIPALANTALTNYDTTAAVTTNTTYTANSATATVASATGLAKGQQLINANVLQGTVITAISGTTITLSSPALSTAAASSTIYSALTVQIYRTINGGSVFFYLGMVANGTTTFTDNVSDATVQLQQPIYTSANAKGYDQPPTNVLAIAQTNDTFWFATNTTLYQSIQGAPGACPSTFSNQFEQKIVGLSDIISFPVLFCDKSVYRIEGLFDSFGNGGFVPRKISETAGCISNSSIVKTPYGLVWFGNGGIFLTDGYKVQKISNHLDQSYLAWSSRTNNIKGAYDSTKNMVYWTVATMGSTTLPNNAFLVLHMNYAVDDEAVFTTALSTNNWYPTAVAFTEASDLLASDPLITTTATWTSGTPTMTVASASGLVVGQLVTAVGVPYGTYIQTIVGTTVTLTKNTNQSGTAATITLSQVIYSQLYRRLMFTDVNGYLLWFDPNSLADVMIDTTLYPTQMKTKAIFYEWITSGLDQGVKGFRKYNPDVVLEVDAATPVAIQIRHRRDDGGGGWSGEGGSPPTGQGVAGSPGGGTIGNPGVPEIRQDGALTWGITDCTWATDSNEHLWNDFRTVSGKRTVPANQLRSGRRQLKFVPAFTIIARSDDYSTATVSGAGTGQVLVTLDNTALAWITDPEGYYLTLAVDGYNQTYYIKNRQSDTILQLTDPLLRIANGSTKWQIKGYRKFERPRILSFTLNAEVDGPTYGQATTPTGANS